MRMHVFEIGNVEVPEKLVAYAEYVTDKRINKLGKFDIVLYIDRKDCFEKISKCPIILPIPISEEQENFIKEKMEWLLTYDGYKFSKEYDLEKLIDEYPNDKLVT